jgi:chitodextrinase
VNFTAEELDLPETDYWYEINMIDASDNVTIQPLGKFRVIR